MAPAKIKTAEERERLDRIFAEVEAAERGEALEPAETRTQEQIDEDNRKAKIRRLSSLERKEFLGNVKSIAGNDGFKTKYERILSQFILNQLAPMNEEINILRNFANAVDNKLQKAEKAAKEQDNHHYYKIFAEGVKTLLESI
ncbi:hypothetical protein [uncultured Fibrobacter sp.]|uniref:hypothetical protein n=1 Tax=uncultured Fibrobacter sp. TaxID=261512 RepID=UPI0025F1F9B9|nr:hypothetical protein [uncultured Fibrobacter sp.]